MILVSQACGSMAELEGMYLCTVFSSKDYLEHPSSVQG